MEKEEGERGRKVGAVRKKRKEKEKGFSTQKDQHLRKVLTEHICFAFISFILQSGNIPFIKNDVWPLGYTTQVKVVFKVRVVNKDLLC